MGRRKTLIHIILIVLMIFSISFLAACSSGTTTENVNKTLENEITLQLYDQIDKSNMTEAEKKLSTDLLYLAEANGSQSSSQPVINSDSFQSSNFIPADSTKGVNENLVHVYVYLNEGINIDVIQPFVNEITGRDEENSVAAAWVSVSKMKELASMEEVRNIRTIIPPVVNVGSVTTEGDEIHGTASVRTNDGPDGSGIKIGVISDGVNYLAESKASGNLPDDVTVLSDSYGGDEGTAMLEIIHDMTPGAKLYFHDWGTSGYISFNDAIDELVSAGWNIIVDDVGIPDQAYFEDGEVARHVAEVIKENNILYVSAAGNDANKHYQAAYIDDNGNNLNDIIFPIDIKQNDEFRAYLQWDDPWYYSSNDYDLLLGYEDGTRVPLNDPRKSDYNSLKDVFISGETVQNGTSNPFEIMYFKNVGAGEVVYIYIRNFKGEAEPRLLELFIDTSVDYNYAATTPKDSIYGHPAVPEVIAVGAISALDGNHDDIEYFSSQGPVTITYPVASQRQKPDICGVDGVATAAARFNPFYGTSAAAPHVAAVAAQIWSSNPAMTAAEVRNILLSSAADDRGIVGYDTVFGYGIANSSKYFMNQVPTVDKAPLITAIVEANVKVGAAVPGKDINQYPQTAIDVFNTAIAAAQAVVDNPAATQADVDLAIANLTTASAIFDAAKITAVDKAPLIAAIETAKAKVGAAVAGTEDGQYPQTAIDLFNAAIATAQAVVDNPAATQVEVNQASANLAAASVAFDAAKVMNGKISLDFASRLGGIVSNVAISGNYAYIGQGQDVLVINISDESNPSEIGRVTTKYLIKSIEILGNYAYVADGENGLVILDITNPAVPTIKGSCDTIGFAADVAVVGNYAYVADWGNGLVILDIMNPAAPTIKGGYDTAGNTEGVTVVGNFAYVADGENGLIILDITNPAAPTIKGSYDTTNSVMDIAVVGNFAYVADGTNGLLVVDITNPAAPTFKGSCDTIGFAADVAVVGNFAYVADGWNDLLIVDITDPAVPTIKGTHTTIGSGEDVVVVGNYAYVAEGINGLAILDITDPAVPIVEGSYYTTGNVWDVTVVNNYAYLADGWNGLLVVDISDPAVPTIKGSFDTIYSTSHVVVVDNYAYIADGENGLVILDFTNPAVPTLRGSYDTDGFASAVAVVGSYAYVADGENGLVIMDITNPAAPTIKGSCDTPGSADDVAVVGSYAYVADEDNGLVIVDITNPTAPTIKGSFDTAGYTNGVTVAGNFAYVADAYNGLVILDITNPAVPTLRGSYDTPGSVESVAVVGKYAYIADDDNGLVVVDITNPAAPTMVSTYDTPGGVLGVAVAGNYAYLADVDNGLVILHIGTDSGTTPLTISELSGKDITTSSITLSWTNSADVSRVDIYRNNVLLGNVTGSTSYVDSNLASDTTYSYTLIPYNMNGLVGEAVSISLKTKSSSSGGGGGGGSSGGSTSKKSSSSGGGGGGAGSVEDFANVAMKDVDNQYLKINANATYEFSREGNPIQSVSFYSLKNSGEITSTIEVLNNKSKLVNSTPGESIYKFVNIWVGKAGFATTTNIKDPSIKFKVASSWMEEMGVNPEDVKLQRYNGKTWEVLPTVVESNDTSYVIFKAQTPGFSNFAITAEKVLASPIANSAEDVSTTATEPEKTPGFGFGIAILMIGLCATGYAHLKKKQD